MFFVVAAAAPLTVMAGIAPLAIMIGGIGAPAGYLIAGLILTVFAVAFTAMSKYIHNAGAFYSYIARGLGKPAGLGAAALAVYSYNAIQIGLYGAFGYFAAITAKDLTGLDLPWWAWAAAGIAVVWFFGYRSIHGGAKILGALLIAETGILALLAAAILLKGGAHGLSLASFAPAHVVTGGMGSVLALAFGAFIGFEATAIYREEARTPDRTVPRATYVAVGFLGLFYAFISWVIIQAFGNTGAVAGGQQEPGRHVLHRHDHLRRRLGHRLDARAHRDQPVRRAARLPQRDHPLHLRAGLRRRAAPPARPHPPRPQEPLHRRLRADRPGRPRRRRASPRSTPTPTSSCCCG